MFIQSLVLVLEAERKVWIIFMLWMWECRHWEAKQLAGIWWWIQWRRAGLSQLMPNPGYFTLTWGSNSWQMFSVRVWLGRDSFLGRHQDSIYKFKVDTGDIVTWNSSMGKKEDLALQMKINLRSGSHHWKDSLLPETLTEQAEAWASQKKRKQMSTLPREKDWEIFSPLRSLLTSRPHEEHPVGLL